MPLGEDSHFKLHYSSLHNVSDVGRISSPNPFFVCHSFQLSLTCPNSDRPIRLLQECIATTPGERKEIDSVRVRNEEKLKRRIIVKLHKLPVNLKVKEWRSRWLYFLFLFLFLFRRWQDLVKVFFLSFFSSCVLSKSSAHEVQPISCSCRMKWRMCSWNHPPSRP